jgi:hypothetical protein
LIWADRKRLPPESEKVPFELEHEEERMKNLDLDFGLWSHPSSTPPEQLTLENRRKKKKLLF